MVGRASFWRRTPPALFPSTLGAIGLSLGWRSAAEVLGAPLIVADALLIASGGVFCFILIAYIAKLSVRPVAVFDDLSPVPGRAAVSAGSMCLMVLAAGILRATGEAALAERLWLLGLSMHVVYMVCVIIVLARLPATERKVTPVLFLPFVGYIVSPFAGPDLGYYDLSYWIFMYTLFGGAIILALAMPPYFLRPTPPPARAAAAIALAPLSVGAISADALELTQLAKIFCWANLPVAALLLARIRWLTASGITPLWGAFTFPSASFAGLCVLGASYYGGWWIGLAWAALIAATVIVIFIWLFTLLAWSQGKLAPATSATTV